MLQSSGSKLRSKGIKIFDNQIHVDGTRIRTLWPDEMEFSVSFTFLDHHRRPVEIFILETKMLTKVQSRIYGNFKTIWTLFCNVTNSIRDHGLKGWHDVKWLEIWFTPMTKPFNQQKPPNAKWQHKTPPKNVDCKTIADRLRMGSLSTDSHQTGVIKAV